MILKPWRENMVLTLPKKEKNGNAYFTVRYKWEKHIGGIWHLTTRRDRSGRRADMWSPEKPGFRPVMPEMRPNSGVKCGIAACISERDASKQNLAEKADASKLKT
jgi:hypothetical protein